MKKASVLGVSIFAVILLLFTTAGSAFGSSPSRTRLSPDGLRFRIGIGHPVWWPDRSLARLRRVGTTKPGSSIPNLKNGRRCTQAQVPVDLVAEIWPTILKQIESSFRLSQTTCLHYRHGLMMPIMIPGPNWQMDPRNMLGQRIVYDFKSDRIIMFGGFEITKY